MDPVKVAAHFVAFACYLNDEAKEPHSPEAAGKFARGNWKRFLPYVREDLTMFLNSKSNPQAPHMLKRAKRKQTVA